MLRAIAIISLMVFVLCPLPGGGADIPDVLVVWPETDNAFRERLESELRRTFVFAPLRSDMMIRYAGVSNTAGIAEYLRSFDNEHGYRVLLTQCPPDDCDTLHYGRQLAGIADLAEQKGLEMLFYDCHTEVANRTASRVMGRYGITIADYGGFCRTLNGKPDGSGETQADLRRRCEYIAESAAQWWTGMARGNREILRIPIREKQGNECASSDAEYINAAARIDGVGEPELEVFLPLPGGMATAIIVFPGGGYSFLGFLRNARELAETLRPYGIAVFALKYRTKQGIGIPLSDAKQAMQIVRRRAQEWGIDPNRVGVVGQSAGAHLVLNLISSCNPDNYMPPGETVSCRPDFAAALTLWNFLDDRSPFVFTQHTPPVFIRQARNDSGIRFAENVVKQLVEADAPVDYKFIDGGGHGAFEIAPENPGWEWPLELVSWLEKTGLYNLPKK